MYNVVCETLEKERNEEESSLNMDDLAGGRTPDGVACAMASPPALLSGDCTWSTMAATESAVKTNDAGVNPSLYRSSVSLPSSFHSSFTHSRQCALPVSIYNDLA